MLNTPPHLEARVPRGFVSIFHGTSSSVARRRLRASDLSFRQSMPSFDIGRPGLQMQSGASAVLGGVGELPGSRCTDFNPRAPCGARPSMMRSSPSSRVHFNPRAPCGARPCLYHPQDGQHPISIHAPRVGRDRELLACRLNLSLISIHAPRVGRDITGGLKVGMSSISIHAPRVGRDARQRSTAGAVRISIHAPRVGRDA